MVEAHPGAYPGIAPHRGFVELVVGNSGCSYKRRDRRHPCPAKGEYIAHHFGLFAHGLSSDGTVLLISPNPVWRFDERTLGISEIDHKRKELSSKLRKIQG